MGSYKMIFDFDAIEPTKKWTIDTLNDRLGILSVGEVLRIEGLPNDVYHGCNGISTSKIKLFLECPYKYFCAFIEKSTEFKHQSYFDFGDTGHTTILEPEKFESRYVRQPDEIKKRSGARWDSFLYEAEVLNKTVLTGNQYDAMPKLKEAINRNKDAVKFTTGGVAEVSYFKIDEDTGFVVKCRTDYEIRRGGKFIISDLKTTKSSDPRFMDGNFKKLGYHIQDAVYSDITGTDAFVFVAVESKEPYVVTAPIIMPSELKRLGHLKYRKAMRGIKQCMESGVWPMYVSGAHTVKTNKFDLDELEKLENEYVA